MPSVNHGCRNFAGASSACVIVTLLTGCGGSRGFSASPTPVQSDGVEYVAQHQVSVPAEDSVADGVALGALRDLDITSLGKGGHRLASRVTVSRPSPAGARRPTDNGGTASVSYDLNIETYLSHSRVMAYMEYFRGSAKDRFAIWLSRLQRYQGMIQRRFREYGLPMDLVYLALIESGYSNTAVSRSRAVGMWQFMSFTARRYGLRIDDWVDERRDPFLATDAAARHLADLKDEFGAWYLAAAAYNGGAGRVSRGLRRLTGIPNTDDAFFELSARRYLRRETRDYVPKLIAATRIAKEPHRYGFTDIPPLPPLVFDEIVIADQTGLDVLASLADTSTAALVELNPQYYRGATPPGERATVRVPRGSGVRVLAAYAGLPPSERINFVEHRVRRGETLGHIGQSYRVSVADIRAANPGVSPRRLRIGQRLTIPISRVARSSGSLGAGVSRQAAVRAPSHGFHTVRPGDSLWKIAQRFGVSISQLREWNRIRATDSVLRVGERIQVVSPSAQR